MVHLCISGGLIVIETLISGLVFGYETPGQVTGAMALGVLGGFPTAYRVAGLFFGGGAPPV